LEGLTQPVELSNREVLINCVKTSLSSKIVSSYSDTLSPIAVDAVLKIIDAKTATNVDLNDIKICKKVGGTIEDTELVHGLIFNSSKVSHAAGGPVRIINPKIAIIQFCLTAPKTDIEN
jgi:T-complex protein 1 subunit delta